MKLEWKKVRKYLGIAKDLLDKVPEKGDNPLKIFLKLLAIVDVFDQRIKRDGNLYDFFSDLDVSANKNGQFIDLFFSTPLGDSFEIVKIPISDYADVVIATDKELGTLYFVEYHWGTKAEVSNEFWSTKGFDFKKALERTWTLFNNEIQIGLTFDPNRERPKTAYTPLIVLDEPLIGEANQRLEAQIKKHRRARENGFPRTYLFAGKQGVGKSTFALRLARACGKRTVVIDSNGLTVAGANDLCFLVEGLRPDFVILDDIDRIAEVGTTLPMLMSAFTDLKKRYPEVTTILTVNDLKVFPAAVIRPGRVDVIIKFKDPNLEERREILKGYLAEFKVPCEDPEVFVNATDGLTAAYLLDIAIQLKNAEEPEEVLSSIAQMKELSEEKKEAPAKASDSPPSNAPVR